MSEMPDLADLIPAQRRFVRANGLDFEIFEAGEGDRFALLLHGFPEHAISWRAQIPVLVAAGFRVWAVNQRGYGDTSMPPAGHYSLDDLTGDVAALIDASGAHAVTLIAHDWGALVAWTFAIRRVRPLERLIILNVPHPLCFRVALKQWRQRRKSWYTLFFQIPALPDWLLSRQNGRPVAALLRDTAVNRAAFPRETLAVYAANAARAGGMSAMLAWYREAGRDLARAKDLSRVIDVPTLIIWGERDVALDVMCLVGTDRFVPDLRIERLPQASHWVQQDAPETVNRLIAEFVNEAVA
jgi:pimeloyl-ACP methyl ester carboxylesterase